MYVWGYAWVGCVDKGIRVSGLQKTFLEADHGKENIVTHIWCRDGSTLDYFSQHHCCREIVIVLKRLTTERYCSCLTELILVLVPHHVLIIFWRWFSMKLVSSFTLFLKKFVLFVSHSFALVRYLFWFGVCWNSNNHIYKVDFLCVHLISYLHLTFKPLFPSHALLYLRENLMSAAFRRSPTFSSYTKNEDKLFRL